MTTVFKSFPRHRSFPLQIIITHQPLATVVTLRGSFDVAACEAALSDLTVLADEKPAHVILDMSGCVYLASLGLGVILQTAQMITRYGGTLRLAAPSPAVKSVLDAVQLPRALPVDQTVAAALEEARIAGSR
jgi:anti-anti-sigma factor